MGFAVQGAHRSAPARTPSRLATGARFPARGPTVATWTIAGPFAQAFCASAVVLQALRGPSSGKQSGGVGRPRSNHSCVAAGLEDFRRRSDGRTTSQFSKTPGRLLNTQKRFTKSRNVECLMKWRRRVDLPNAF